MSDGNNFENRFLVRELYGHCSVASATQDVDAWISCWAENGRWITPHFEKVGRAELRQAWDMTWTNFTDVAAFSEIGPIKVSGRQAEVEACVLEIIKMKNGSLMKMAGLYRDELCKGNGQWRFSRRVYELLSQEVTP